SPDRVYGALNDPAVLVRTIPGCERLEQMGVDAYRMTVTAGVASIRGSFSGDIRLCDQRPPHSFVLRASGSGAPGTVTADVAVTLADSGGGSTLLSYDADAVVGGMVGGVGQRVLSGVARKTAAEFFAAIDDVLTAAVPEPGAPAGALEAGAPEPVATEPVATEPVATEPGVAGIDATAAGAAGTGAPRSRSSTPGCATHSLRRPGRPASPRRRRSAGTARTRWSASSCPAWTSRRTSRSSWWRTGWSSAVSAATSAPRSGTAAACARSGTA